MKKFDFVTPLSALILIFFMTVCVQMLTGNGEEKITSATTSNNLVKRNFATVNDANSCLHVGASCDSGYECCSNFCEQGICY